MDGTLDEALDELKQPVLPGLSKDVVFVPVFKSPAKAKHLHDKKERTKAKLAKFRRHQNRRK